MPSAPSTPIEDYREYLLLLGRLQLAPAIAAKLDLSGVVQQTLWEAGRSPVPAGDDEARLAWLRSLLANNLRDEIRKLTAARRDVRRERQIEAALGASSSRICGWLASRDSSPSTKAIRAEELNRLAKAVAALPDDQRLAIELHHLKNESLAEVARQLGRTKEATASLLYRALKKLRQKLDSPENRP